MNLTPSQGLDVHLALVKLSKSLEITEEDASAFLALLPVAVLLASLSGPQNGFLLIVLSWMFWKILRTWKRKQFRQQVVALSREYGVDVNYLLTYYQKIRDEGYPVGSEGEQIIRQLSLDSERDLLIPCSPPEEPDTLLRPAASSEETPATHLLRASHSAFTADR